MEAKNMKHTPGPYITGTLGRIYAGSITVARVITDEQDERIGASEADANQRLLAAAPALLAALEAIMSRSPAERVGLRDTLVTLSGNTLHAAEAALRLARGA